MSKLLSLGGNFVVLCDTYVTEESGTGIVHQVRVQGMQSQTFIKAEVFDIGQVFFYT